MNKCCHCRLLLRSAGLLSDDQQLAPVNEVVARLESKSHSVKMAALKLLEEMGKRGRCRQCLSLLEEMGKRGRCRQCLSC